MYIIVGGAKTLGPIRRYFWKRKFNRKAASYLETIHLLHLLGKLELWHPSADVEFVIKAQITLRNTLKDMMSDLSENSY
jgi:hypothetical protein